VHRVRLACFDVLDTTLLRIVAAPSDVFRLVFADLRRSLGPLFLEWDEDSFVSARLQAEQRAIAACGHEECTLDEIWRELSSVFQAISRGQGAGLELEAERRVLRPNVEVLRLVYNARRSGHAIAFVSDTPLPRSFLAEQLRGFNIMAPEDCLYVSSDLRLLKKSGRLYKKILQITGLEPKEISMFGDNINSDVAVPRRLGLRAHHYIGTATHPGGRPTRSLRSANSQHGATSPSEIRNVSSVLERSLEATSLVERYLGPACLAWAIWVLLRARECNIRRLYFVSRDAFLVWRCASALSSIFNIDCRYLMISRQAILPAATTIVSRSALDWLIRPWDSPTYRLICRRLEIESGQCTGRLRSLLQSRGLDSPLTSTDREQFWSALEDPDTQELLLRKFAEKRVDARGYLEQEGLLDGVKWALVDLGWHLSLQRGINSLVQPWASARGLYVYLSAERALPPVAGWATAMFPLAPPDSRSCRRLPCVARFPTIAEHVFGIAPQGTTVGYQNQGGSWKAIAQLEAEEMSPWRSKVEKAIDEYVKKHGDMFLETLNKLNYCRAAYDIITNDLFLTPEPNVVRELAKCLRISSDTLNVNPSRVARPIRMSELMRLMLPGKIATPVYSNLQWPEGCIRISPPHFRKCIQIRRRLSQLLHEDFGSDG